MTSEELPRPGPQFAVNVKFEVSAAVSDDRGHVAHVRDLVQQAVWSALAENGYIEQAQTVGPVLAAEGHATPTVVTGEVEAGVPLRAVEGPES
jgi:hypothetical protein